jgi:hypothetical protein
MRNLRRIGPNGDEWGCPVKPDANAIGFHTGGRTEGRETITIETFLRYPAYHFNYSIRVEAKDGGVSVSVHLDQPLPAELAGASRIESRIFAHYVLS